MKTAIEGASSCVALACVLVIGACSAADPRGGSPDASSAPVVLARLSERCSASTLCETGLFCAYPEAGAAEGHCAEPCATLGDSCDGAVGDSVAYCAIESVDGLRCGFVCRVDHGDHGHSYPCPDGLRCLDVAVAGGELYLCAP